MFPAKIPSEIISHMTFRQYNSIWIISSLQCQGQYSARVNEVRTYMRQIDSDVNLRREEKVEFKLSKLMQGNNKGRLS